MIKIKANELIGRVVGNYMVKEFTSNNTFTCDTMNVDEETDQVESISDNISLSISDLERELKFDNGNTYKIVID